MGWLARLRSTCTKDGGAPEQAVIVEYSLGRSWDTDALFESLGELEDDLIAAIEAARAGEFDGNVIGSTDLTLYAYGPDADRLYAVMEPRLRQFPARPAHVTLRYGEVTDPVAPERRIDL